MFVAQIRSAKIRLIEEHDEWPAEYLPEFGWMDITDTIPFPAVGWTYTEEDGFSSPVIRVYLRIQTSKRKLVNDGVDFISVTITLYDADRVLIPANQQGRLILRDDKANIYDLLWFQLASGTVTFNYTTTGNAAIVHLSNQDDYMEDIGGNLYLIKSFIDESETLQIGREV